MFSYYEPASSRFAVVNAGGDVDRETDGDTKIASATIHIEAEIFIPTIVTAAIKWTMGRCDPVKTKHSTGNQSASSSTGNQSASSSTGENAVAMNIGVRGKAKASKGGAIVLCNHDENYNVRHIRASKVGENGIKPDTWYMLNDQNDFVEVE